MLQNAKAFANALNESLDELGAPANTKERAVVLSKMLNIPKQQAWALIEGQAFPDADLLDQITSELEINIKAS